MGNTFSGLVYPDELEVRFLARSPSHAQRPDGSYYDWDERMLLKEFRCMWDQGVITAPAGFIYNGASIPKKAQALYQKNGSWQRPSVIHDWLYTEKKTTREYADDLLEESLVRAGTPSWGIYWFMLPIRTFGQSAWDNDK